MPTNKAGLTLLFAQGDIPQGTDYANLINSQVNLAETVEQDMAGPLSTPKLISPRVSAGTITGNIQSATVSANTVYASAAHINAVIGLTTIISAAGTAQATASPINPKISINLLQGTADGSQSGYLLPSPVSNVGLGQTLVHQGAVSGNLWPNIGCKINGLGTNGAFALAANTPYYVTYVSVSAYAVK